MIIRDVVNSFSTTPFLFVGSGLSRRYINLPSWVELLKHFSNVLNADEFSYNFYENQAQSLEHPYGIMPKIAELIQLDFDKYWFQTPSIRTLSDDELEYVRQGVSPFKAEIAHFLKNSYTINSIYEKEISLLEEISKHSLSGIITTNYDSFLEDHLKDFVTYVGQEELIFSALQGIAEIYKIHGSVTNPNSIIINEADYADFNSKSPYLAAKLMTVFMEYPIIFIGYSINDSNILNIINAIVSCLNDNQLQTLAHRFIFIEYCSDITGVEVSPHTIMIGNKPLAMTKIRLSDFSLLYQELLGKKSKLPVRLLRRFKEELYNYTITSVPTANLRVAAIDDNRVGNEELVMAIGKVSTLGLKGLSGLEANEWYRNIILDDLDFSADDLLVHAFPKLIRQNSGVLPLNKYLANAQKAYPECTACAHNQKFESGNNQIIAKSFIQHRNYVAPYTSVKEIWDNEKTSVEKATRLMAYLTEDQFDVTELENVLHEIFHENVNVLSDSSARIRTNIRRLIRVYDYLKWGYK